ncbi:sulfite exporter TauE/SafE family protein [Sphaerospermopsis sp. LEGE 00249]|uniref:sulfite exporter TauE/SafE family protein n=1 Tax=Sphaerospermopsis sp. LEGE 00249 TaxID=1380707 RepID=UPI00164E0524|nr:sulfite exporter TauE/SafE family protein [Sphaerospermopsis sp. LEGE 00249]MBC5795962.1 sulfite exporter TauE/SafE family protein [Sphaerospermopsis sp. LEGE 00249]
MIWILGHILATGIGISLGLIGGGGSVLALPILVYVMGVPTKPAIAMTLVIVGTVSLIGLIPHWKKGNINFKKAFIFGSATMLGAFLGAKIAYLPFVTDNLQMLLFAIMMLVAASLMIKRSLQNSTKLSSKDHLENIKTEVYQPPVCQYCWLWLLTEGLGVGILTGLVGVGGGFAIVPALVILGKTPMKEAIGTSLLILVVNAISGFLGYLGQVDLDWNLIGSFVIAASLGSFFGAYLSQFIDGKKLQKYFGYFLIAVAAFVLFQNQSASPRKKSALNWQDKVTILNPVQTAQHNL